MMPCKGKAELNGITLLANAASKDPKINLTLAKFADIKAAVTLHEEMFNSMIERIAQINDDESFDTVGVGELLKFCGSYAILSNDIGGEFLEGLELKIPGLIKKCWDSHDEQQHPRSGRSITHQRANDFTALCLKAQDELPMSTLIDDLQRAVGESLAILSADCIVQAFKAAAAKVSSITNLSDTNIEWVAALGKAADGCNGIKLAGDVERISIFEASYLDLANITAPAVMTKLGDTAVKTMQKISNQLSKAKAARVPGVQHVFQTAVEVMTQGNMYHTTHAKDIEVFVKAEVAGDFKFTRSLNATWKKLIIDLKGISKDGDFMRAFAEKALVGAKDATAAIWAYNFNSLKTELDKAHAALEITVGKSDDHWFDLMTARGGYPMLEMAAKDRPNKLYIYIYIYILIDKATRWMIGSLGERRGKGSQPASRQASQPLAHDRTRLK